MRSTVILIELLVRYSTLPAGAQGLPNGSDSLHTVELGAGSTTVIVLHGGPGFSHKYLRPEWDVLARRYRVVYYDQRGCGRSERRGPYDWRHHVADLHTLILRYRVNGPVVFGWVLLGELAGALVCLEPPTTGCCSSSERDPSLADY